MSQGLNVNPRIKLKLARVAHNLTQAELAEKVGVTRQTIGLIENGRYNPTLRLCIAIARALDKTLNDLFWEESEHEVRR
jgi:putative transcriptional regulator